MFPISSYPAECPDSWCAQPYIGWKCVKIYPEVNDVILQDWRIITGGMNCVLHEPITGSVNFDVFI